MSWRVAHFAPAERMAEGEERAVGEALAPSLPHSGGPCTTRQSQVFSRSPPSCFQPQVSLLSPGLPLTHYPSRLIPES